MEEDSPGPPCVKSSSNRGRFIKGYQCSSFGGRRSRLRNSKMQHGPRRARVQYSLAVTEIFNASPINEPQNVSMHRIGTQVHAVQCDAMGKHAG